MVDIFDYEFEDEESEDDCESFGDIVRYSLFIISIIFEDTSSKIVNGLKTFYKNFRDKWLVIGSADTKFAD